MNSQVKVLHEFLLNLSFYQSNHMGESHKLRLYNSWSKLDDSFKELFKKKRMPVLYRGTDSNDFQEPAMSFTKNKSVAKSFGHYLISTDNIKSSEGNINTDKVIKFLNTREAKRKLPVDEYDIGNDEGEIIFLNITLKKNTFTNKYPTVYENVLSGRKTDSIYITHAKGLLLKDFTNGIILRYQRDITI